MIMEKPIRILIIHYMTISINNNRVLCIFSGFLLFYVLMYLHVLCSVQ